MNREQTLKACRLLAAMLASWNIAGPGWSRQAETEIVIRADIRRFEIERILVADNLDTSRLAPREVADRTAAIPRGRAPEDFWLAYQVHVDAWQRLAEAIENVRQSDNDEVRVAERSINASFDDVERIARRYGAEMPRPATAPHGR